MINPMRALRILLVLLPFVCFHTSTAQLITKKESAGIDKILDDASRVYKPKTYLFKNVNILTMIDSVILENQNVLVENGIIKKIGKGVEQPGAIQIEGTGKYLMPGLTDMHVHLFTHHPLMKTGLLLLLINGVTSVRDMGGEADKIALRNEIKNNSVLAPNLYQAGSIIDHGKDPYELFVTATTPEEGRKLVVQHKETGYDFIKVYDGIKNGVFLAILDEAHKQNISVVGHIPKDVPLSDAINAGLNSAEHLNGYKTWKEGKFH
jgi:hypothetical protein